MSGETDEIVPERSVARWAGYFKRPVTHHEIAGGAFLPVPRIPRPCSGVDDEDIARDGGAADAGMSGDGIDLWQFPLDVGPAAVNAALAVLDPGGNCQKSSLVQ